MTDSGCAKPVRVVHDVYGRRYRVGERDSELIGRSRAWMIRLPWASVALIGLFQYGYAAGVPALIRTYGWSLAEAFWVLAVWVLFQAGVSVLAMWLYQRARKSLAALMFTGAALCLLALLTLGHTGQLGAVLLGYSVLGGIGSGLVYSTCVATVTEWFPDRTGTMVGVVSSAFGYGAVPFIVVASYALGVDNHAVILDSAGVVVFVVVGVSGLLMRKPPKDWWPAQIDPQFWAVDRRLNRSLPNNVPTKGQYSVRAALHSGTLQLMVLVVVVGAAITLFDVAYLASFGLVKAHFVVAAAIGALALMTGLGRAAAGVLSDRLGRRSTLRLAMAVGGFAQFGLLAAVHGQYTPAVVVFAGLAGTGTGASYPLLVGMVREWFGEDAKLSNYGFIYTGKALGGVLGIGLAGLAVTSPGATVAFAVAGCLGLFGAAVTRRMTQPGRRATPLPPVRLNSLRRWDVPVDAKLRIQQAVADAQGYSMRLQ